MERGPRGRHRRAHDLAATAIDFELRAEEAGELRDHLSGCADCMQADALALVELAFAFAAAPARRRVNGSGGRYNPAR
jgi:hypothetical protein